MNGAARTALSWLVVAVSSGAPGAPGAPARSPAPQTRFAISFPAARSAAPLDGRLLLMISSDSTAEPRFQISDGPNTQLIFGIDVNVCQAGHGVAERRRSSTATRRSGARTATS